MSLRTTFGEDPELYDRVRPSYPRELFDELARIVGGRYSTAEYLELLSSYSGHRALTTDRRDGLYDCIGAHLDATGESVTKRYVNQLSVEIPLTKPLRSGRSAGGISGREGRSLVDFRV